jgi:hypothetical protein
VFDSDVQLYVFQDGNRAFVFCLGSQKESSLRAARALTLPVPVIWPFTDGKRLHGWSEATEAWWSFR